MENYNEVKIYEEYCNNIESDTLYDKDEWINIRQYPPQSFIPDDSNGDYDNE